jgi:hypothetical protein
MKNISRLLTGCALTAAVVTPAQAIVVDGQRDATGYSVGALQSNPTAWGANNVLANLYYNNLDPAQASLFVGGRPDGNAFLLFVDSVPGGQNVLNNTQLGGDGYMLNNLNGFKFDAGFEADFMMRVYGDAGGNAFVNFFSLADNSNAYLGNANPGPVVLPGVSFASNWQNVTAGYDPAAITTGFEISFAYGLVGIAGPAATWKVSAILANGGSDYLSNQQLGTLPAGTPDIAGSGSGNWDQTLFAGDQYVVIPEPATAALFGAGLGLLLALRSRRQA